MVKLAQIYLSQTGFNEVNLNCDNCVFNGYHELCIYAKARADAEDRADAEIEEIHAVWAAH